VTAVEANHALVERILTESAVVRELPEPGLTDYLAWLVEAVLRRLAASLGGLLDTTGWNLRAVSQVVAIVLLAVLLAALARALLAARRRGARAPRSTPHGAGPARTPAPAPAWDRQRWLGELEARLDRRDARGALEALWWWLARTLAGERAERSWTNRELLARSGRSDIAALVVGLDRLAYGAEAPRTDEVRRLLAQLREALA
jgi:hypothetical protein